MATKPYQDQQNLAVIKMMSDVLSNRNNQISDEQVTALAEENPWVELAAVKSDKLTPEGWMRLPKEGLIEPSADYGWKVEEFGPNGINGLANYLHKKNIVGWAHDNNEVRGLVRGVLKREVFR